MPKTANPKITASDFYDPAREIRVPTLHHFRMAERFFKHALYLKYGREWQRASMSRHDVDRLESLQRAVEIKKADIQATYDAAAARAKKDW